MAFPLGNTILPGYVTVSGAKYYLSWDHTGPSSYTQIVTGANPTGGDVINAADLGIGGFEFVDAMMDTTGVYYAEVIPIGGGGGAVGTKVALVWFVASTQLQVGAGVNLSAISLRMQAWCV
jgi:hypothetical protein